MLFRVFFQAATSYETSLMELSSDRDLKARQHSVRKSFMMEEAINLCHFETILRLGINRISCKRSLFFFRNHSALGMFAEVLAALVTFLMEGCSICNVLLSRSCTATLTFSRASEFGKK